MAVGRRRAGQSPGIRERRRLLLRQRPAYRQQRFLRLYAARTVKYHSLNNLFTFLKHRNTVNSRKLPEIRLKAACEKTCDLAGTLSANLRLKHCLRGPIAS